MKIRGVPTADGAEKRSHGQNKAFGFSHNFALLIGPAFPALELQSLVHLRRRMHKTVVGVYFGMDASEESAASIATLLRKINKRGFFQRRTSVITTIQKALIKTKGHPSPTIPLPRFNKWTRESVLVLKKKGYGNFVNDELFEGLSRLEIHLNMHDKLFWSHKKQLEWHEIELHADEISALIKRLSSR